MANEITVQSRLMCTNGNLKFDYPTGNVLVTQTAAGGPTPGYVTIGTTEESFAFPELSTLGFLIMRNLDATNYVQWGFATGVYGGRMRAGEPAGPFRLEPGATLYLKANTAACKVLLYALES